MPDRSSRRDGQKRRRLAAPEEEGSARYQAGSSTSTRQVNEPTTRHPLHAGSLPEPVVGSGPLVSLPERVPPLYLPDHQVGTGSRTSLAMRYITPGCEGAVKRSLFADWSPRPLPYPVTGQDVREAANERLYCRVMVDVAERFPNTMQLSRFRDCIVNLPSFLAFIFHTIPIPEERQTQQQVLADLRLIAITAAFCSANSGSPLINAELQRCYRAHSQYFAYIENNVKILGLTPIHPSRLARN